MLWNYIDLKNILTEKLVFDTHQHSEVKYSASQLLVQVCSSKMKKQKSQQEGMSLVKSLPTTQHLQTEEWWLLLKYLSEL